MLGSFHVISLRVCGYGRRDGGLRLPSAEPRAQPRSKDVPRGALCSASFCDDDVSLVQLLFRGRTRAAPPPRGHAQRCGCGRPVLVVGKAARPRGGHLRHQKAEAVAAAPVAGFNRRWATVGVDRRIATTHRLRLRVVEMPGARLGRELAGNALLALGVLRVLPRHADTGEILESWFRGRPLLGPLLGVQRGLPLPPVHRLLAHAARLCDGLGQRVEDKAGTLETVSR
mmetsp:Transcript_13986/g.37154  ORF Transcript_13986/g.37154 Transcript_13986/m.37154 type:complete len:228 (-) Transcript_13986:325-1008(-)